MNITTPPDTIDINSTKLQEILDEAIFKETGRHLDFISRSRVDDVTLIGSIPVQKSIHLVVTLKAKS